MAESKKPFKGYNKKKHSRTGGLNDKYRKKINREEGSNLKRPVTGKVEPGSKAAKRRKSFCSRMSGVKGPTSKDGELTPKGAALKRWKCHKSLQKSDMAPKQKLASFLREHIDNKLALKAAEPTITKSNEPYSESLEKGSMGRLTISSNEEPPTRKGFKLIKKNNLPNGLQHHVYQKGKYFIHEIKTPEIGEPLSAIRILEKNEDGFLSHIVEDVAVHPNHKNHSFGKQAYLAALSHHGDLESHEMRSEHAEKTWNALKNFKGIDHNYDPTNDIHYAVVKNINDLMSKENFSENPQYLKNTIKKSNTLVGGKGDTKDISDFDAKEVEMGMRVEMEHTKDVSIAKEIVADHLSEDPAYYSKLKGSGLADELNKAGRCWDGYEPTPGKKPYSKGSCRKIKKSLSKVFEKLKKTDEKKYDFNTLDEVKDYFNRVQPIEKKEYHDVADLRDMNDLTEFAMYPKLIGFLDKNSFHPSIETDAADLLGEHTEAIWREYFKAHKEKEALDQKTQEDYDNRYYNWVSKIIDTIHNHINRENDDYYSHSAARTTNSQYISGEKNGQEFSIRLSDHPPKIENDNSYNKNHLSLIYPNTQFYDNPNKSNNIMHQKNLSRNSRHIKGDDKDVHNFLSQIADSKLRMSEHKENDSKIQTKELNKNYVNGGKMQKSYHQRLVKALACKCKEKELKKSISAMAIESGEYQGEPLDSHHHNRIGQEYRAMAKQAHTEGNRNKAREYHEKALMHFRKADEMGFQEEEPLEKKISSKLVGAGLAAAAALTPATPFKEAAKPAAPVAVAKPVVEEQPKVGPPADISKYKTVSPEAANRLFSLGFGKNPEDKFLHNIMQAESTGGKDINHSPITNKKSIHYGTTAFGYWALMPLTVQEIAGRYARQSGKDPRILKIPQMSKHDVNDWLAKNPDVELELARTLARHVTSRFGNTPKAAYAWKYGHNQKDISEEEALKDTYIQKFKDLNEGKSTELTRGLIPASQAFGSK